MPEPLTSVNILENLMIFKILHHEHGCLGLYNFFVSQRPAVILSENEIQTPADRVILTEFATTSFPISKTELKVRNRIHLAEPEARYPGEVATERRRLDSNEASAELSWQSGSDIMWRVLAFVHAFLV